MDIQEIITAAEATTTCNTWTNLMTSGKTHTILNFATRQAAGLVRGQLENAGATVTVERSAYGEYILTAIYTATPAAPAEEAPAAPALAVSYHGAGRWQVTTAQGGKVVGMLHQNSLQAWYATDADGKRLAVHGHREYGGPAYPMEIANTMVEWFPQDSDSQPTHGDPYGV